MSDRMIALSLWTCMLLSCFLGVYGQPTATIRGPDPLVISEAIGTVDVCVNVTDDALLPAQGAEIQVFVSLNQGANPATFESDFRPEQQPLIFMPGTTFRCTSFEIINDNVVERRQESMLVRIRNTDGQITIGTDDIVIITIEDDDRLGIGFTQMQYHIREDVSSFELCTRIDSGAIDPDLMDISLDIILTGGTTEIDVDFVKNLGDNYVFSNSTPRIDCIQIMIIDDDIVEANETFSVRLNAGTSSDFVIFTREETEVIIQDDDFATVTIDPEQLIVAEGNATMNSTRQFCVFLRGITNNVQRDVIVNIAATKVMGTGKDDLALLSNSVTFPSNSRPDEQECFQVLIIGDNFIETDEVFRVIISTIFPDIVGNPSSATITITHDGDAVCSPLQNPGNGTVFLTGNTVGSTANYSCNENFTLVKPETRECTANAGWSGQDPLCRLKCEDLTIINGAVSTDLGFFVEGAIATYTCNMEFELNGSLTRVCLSRQWNGTDPTCLRNCDMLPNPDNGMVTLINGTLEGAVATYTCELGFELIGNSLRVCGNNARWSGRSPMCSRSGVGSVNSAGAILLAMPVLMLTLITHLL